MSTPAPPHATPYHRLATLRPEWSRWWRPLLTIAAAVIAYTILASLLMVGSVLVLTVAGASPSVGRTLGDPTSPLDVFLRAAFAALLGPAALLGVRLGGWRPTALLASVAGRVRWELLARPAVPVLLVIALAAALPVLLGGGRLPSGLSAGRVLGVAVISVLLAPLLAAGEELAVRGLAQQAIGTWLRHPAWAIVLPVPLALIGRGHDRPTLVIAAILALACGYLTWLTGGLELPILLHAAVAACSGVVALLGGAGAPASPVLGVAIIVVALALGRAGSARDGRGLGRPVVRPSDAPAPEPLRV